MSTKEKLYVFFILILTIVFGIAILFLAGFRGDKYDPNDTAYKFIPAAPEDWITMFGDNERTRLIHSISEIRVVVAEQSKRILALEQKLDDPNEKVDN